jgi:heme A synthase
MKPLTIIAGILSAILITVQAVLGLLIRSGGSPRLVASHFHTGMLTAVVVLLYVALSLSLILARPRRPAP